MFKTTSVVGILVVSYFTIQIVRMYMELIFDSSNEVGLIPSVILGICMYWFIDVSFSLVKKLYINITAKRL